MLLSSSVLANDFSKQVDEINFYLNACRTNDEYTDYSASIKSVSGEHVLYIGFFLDGDHVVEAVRLSRVASIALLPSAGISLSVPTVVCRTECFVHGIATVSSVDSIGAQMRGRLDVCVDDEEQKEITHLLNALVKQVREDKQ